MTVVRHHWRPAPIIVSSGNRLGGHAAHRVPMIGRHGVVHPAGRSSVIPAIYGLVKGISDPNPAFGPMPPNAR